MKDNIILKVQGREESINTRRLFFPGGEPHIEILEPHAVTGKRALIEARVGDSEDFMMTLALTDAVKRCEPNGVSLFMPYFPGARQDREEYGFALTAKVYADIINAQNYDRVLVLDPHSPVTPALLNNVVSVPHTALVKSFFFKTNETVQLTGLICPDAGAERRTIALAKDFGGLPVIFARKHRDALTGKLSGFSVDRIENPGTYLIADDICDGGGTFIGLAEEIRNHSSVGKSCRLLLWTTHGIYSKGFDELAKHFHWIGCSDSFPAREGTHPQLIRIGTSPRFHEGA
jgi:ribose-phosphate pyrophosphokinase